MIKPTYSSGFTLLEIMVTLFILMTVGIMITAGLSLVVRTQERMGEKSKLLANLQLAIMNIERDIQQVSSKAILGINNQTLATFMISDNHVEFTRSGAYNLLASNNDSLQRVTYQLDGTTLFRITRNVVNKIPQKNTNTEILLSPVKSFHCQMIPINNPLIKPSTPNDQTALNKNITMGVIIDLETGLGNVKRVIPLAINTLGVDPNAPI